MFSGKLRRNLESLITLQVPKASPASAHDSLRLLSAHIPRSHRANVNIADHNQKNHPLSLLQAFEKVVNLSTP